MINKVVLVGRLTKDIELKKTSNGLSVTQFTIACNRRTTGEPQADFINCVAWKQSAEFLGQYAKKGALLGVEGRIQTRSYDQDNRKVFVTEIVCDNVQIISQKQQEPKQEHKTTTDYYDPSITDADLPF